MLPVIRMLLLVLSYTPLFLMVSCSSNIPRTYSDYYFSSGVPEDSGFTLYDAKAKQVLTNKAVITRSKGAIEWVKLYYEKTNLILTANTFVTPKGNIKSQTITMKAFNLHDFAINDVVQGYTTVTLGREDMDGFLCVLNFRLYDGKFLIPDWDHPFYKREWLERQKQKNANLDKKFP